jgi:hypothetical protein
MPLRRAVTAPPSLLRCAAPAAAPPPAAASGAAPPPPPPPPAAAARRRASATSRSSSAPHWRATSRYSAVRATSSWRAARRSRSAAAAGRGMQEARRGAAGSQSTWAGGRAERAELGGAGGARARAGAFRRSAFRRAPFCIPARTCALQLAHGELQRGHAGGLAQEAQEEQRRVAPPRVEAAAAREVPRRRAGPGCVGRWFVSPRAALRWLHHRPQRSLRLPLCVRRHRGRRSRHGAHRR